MIVSTRPLTPNGKAEAAAPRQYKFDSVSFLDFWSGQTRPTWFANCVSRQVSSSNVKLLHSI